MYIVYVRQFRKRQSVYSFRPGTSSRKYLIRTFFRTLEEYKAKRTVKGKMFMQVGWEEGMS
jgi:hypothetical protein